MSKKSLLLTLLILWQFMEAKILNQEISSPFFIQGSSSEGVSSNKEELNCELQVTIDYIDGAGYPPKVNCSRECSNYSKDKWGWYHQNAFNRTEVMRNIINNEIVKNQDEISTCEPNPELISQQVNHERIRRSAHAIFKRAPLECYPGYEFIEEFNTCLQVGTESVSWDRAKHLCALEGGFLAVIDTEVKQNAIRRFFEKIEDPNVNYVWIGLSDIENEGNFVWVDGSPFCYTSWFKGEGSYQSEPNNALGGENCVMLWKYNSRNLFRNYTWNDAKCTNSNRYLCQIKGRTAFRPKKPSLLSAQSVPTECPNNWLKNNVSNTCYHVGKKVESFDDSSLYCNNVGGKLASISSFFEQQFVNDFLKSQNTGDVWIGLSDRREEGDFEWNDGSKLCYTNWILDQNDNQGDQDCVRLARQNGYMWDDELCSLLLQPLCQQKAKPLLFHTCPSGCIVIKDPSWDSREIERKCTSAIPGSKFCSSLSPLQSEDVLITTNYDVSRPVDVYSNRFCGEPEFNTAYDLRYIYKTNDTAEALKREGFTVIPKIVKEDLLISYEVSNGTYRREYAGSSGDRVGGVNARKIVTVYMALLGVSSNANKRSPKWFCDGVIINRNWIVTAAHCFSNKRLDVVRLGEYDLSDDTTSSIESPLDFGVKRLIMYPEYDFKASYHDLALVELDRAIPYFRIDMRPICLPWDNQANRNLVGQKITLTGWGAEFFGGHATPVAQEVDVTVFDASFCDKSYSQLGDYKTKFPNGISESTTLCAGDVEGGKDSCQGDSGGPVVYKGENNKFTLAGIVSTGYGCGLKDYPGIYLPINQPKYLSWIKQVAFS